MANLLSVHWSLVAKIDGVNRRLGGGFTAPFSQSSITGYPLRGVQRISVPAAGTATLYSWATDGNFELFAVWASAYATLTIAKDTPVSTTNLAASGLNPTTYDEDISTIHPRTFDTDQSWDQALAASRKIYTITVRNRNSAAIVVSSAMAN